MVLKDGSLMLISKLEGSLSTSLGLGVRGIHRLFQTSRPQRAESRRASWCLRLTVFVSIWLLTTEMTLKIKLINMNDIGRIHIYITFEEVAPTRRTTRWV